MPVCARCWQCVVSATTCNVALLLIDKYCVTCPACFSDTLTLPRLKLGERAMLDVHCEPTQCCASMQARRLATPSRSAQPLPSWAVAPLPPGPSNCPPSSHKWDTRSRPLESWACYGSSSRKGERYINSVSCRIRIHCYCSRVRCKHDRAHRPTAQLLHIGFLNSKNPALSPSLRRWTSWRPRRCCSCARSTPTWTPHWRPASGRWPCRDRRRLGRSPAAAVALQVARELMVYPITMS